jgi:hypothetical protein
LKHQHTAQFPGSGGKVWIERQGAAVLGDGPVQQAQPLRQEAGGNDQAPPETPQQLLAASLATALVPEIARPSAA